MTPDPHADSQAVPQPISQWGPRSRIRLWLAVGLVAGVLTLLIVPPLVSIGRYKGQITQLMSASLGRPVRLSSVKLRMLPRPGFVLTELVVDEDAAFGAEPVMHAETVTASIRLAPLWRGRLEISRISVDAASVNLVRSASGQWNLDSLFRTATGRAGGPGSASMALPYMEATNSRINIKNGVEKLPFSLVSADVSLWQESSGEWRVRLRGQPARTDVSLDLPDTGEVRVEATLGLGPQLQQMPLKVDMEWRDAQLGQLTRLIMGSDEGWRGDLRGEVHVIGTAETAQIKTRLRATGVHRAEFAPVTPLDFDATCSFTAHSLQLGLGNVLCDSPVGSGRARLTGDLQEGSDQPRLTLELDRIPAQAALDGLRTLRSTLDSSLVAAGTVSGKMNYEPVTAPSDSRKAAGAKPHALAMGPLSGSFTGEGIQLNGGGLAQSLSISKVTLEPIPFEEGQPAALAATMTIPDGSREPLNVTARLEFSGYEMTVHGTAALANLRELAHLSGVPSEAALDGFAGDAAELDLKAQGPWMATANAISPIDTVSQSTPGAGPAAVTAAPDKVRGTITFRNANWKTGFLANPVEIAGATLHVDSGSLRWDLVSFSYGPVKGTGTLEVPENCAPGEKCIPHFAVRFGSIDGPSLQSALLGARESGTLLSTLIDKLRSSPAPGWPPAEGTAHVDSLALELVTLTNISAMVNVSTTGAEISSLDAGMLGGRVHATGSISVSDKPAYKLQGKLEKLNSQQVGLLCGMQWSGGTMDGSGSVEAAGFTDKDLAASANGTLHFDWVHGAVASDAVDTIPTGLARFDRWTGNAVIGNGTIATQESQVEEGRHKSPVKAALTMGYPPQLDFRQGKSAQVGEP